MAFLFLLLHFVLASAGSSNQVRRLPDNITKYRYGVPENNTPVHFHLSFAGPNGVAVAWETDSDTSSHVCLYGLDKSLSLKATGSSRSYGTVYTHIVLLQNLEMNTRYFYQCGDPAVAMGPVLNFTTQLPAGSRNGFTIALVGDMGIKESSGVASTMVKHISTYDWVLDVGDLGYADDYYLYLSSYEQVYAQFMSEIEPMSSTKTFMGLPGNHEATCNEATPSVCPSYLQNFTAYRNRWRFPSTESGGTANMWYSFDYGMAHFVQISTETDFPSAPEGPGTRLSSGPFGDQMTWLDNDLKKAVANRANVPWIIVSGHRPIWYSAGQDASVNSAFLPLMSKYGVDFYFAGHEHNYERYYPIGSTGHACQTNYNSPNCTIYFVNGAGGNIEGHQSGSGNPDYLVYRNTANYGWSRLTFFNATTLYWEFITENDAIVDSTYITKNYK